MDLFSGLDKDIAKLAEKIASKELKKIITCVNNIHETDILKQCKKPVTLSKKRVVKVKKIHDSV